MLTLILLLTSTVLLIRSSRVQTFLTNKVADYYSHKLHTQVSVGGVDIEFFKKVVLNEVFIQDQHRDTLIFLSKLKLDISNLNFDKHELEVSELELVNPIAKLVKYKGEKDFNYQFFVDAFASKNRDTTKKDSTIWELKCKDLTLNNLFFTYRYERNNATTTSTTNRGIDYENIVCKNVNGKINNIHFEKDTVYFGIENLSVKEKCGLVIRSLSAKTSLSPVGIDMEHLKIITPESQVMGNFKMLYSSFNDFLDYNEKVTMKSHLDSTWVGMSDVAYFAPALNGMHQTIFVSGDVSGKVNGLKCKNMKMHFGTATHFDGSVELTGLPNIDEFVMQINAKKISTIKDDIELLPLWPFEKGETLKVPPNIASLGTISFRGNFTGYLNDFVAYGTFSTALGSFSSDLSMKQNTETRRLFYKGKLKSTGFDIGKFLSVKQVGVIALDANIDGSGLESDKVDANLNGTVTRFDAMGYSYKDALIKARLTKKVFDGSLVLNDDNLKFDFTGSIDFTKKLPQLNFNSDITSANLTALHIIKNKEQVFLSSELDLKMQGNNIDNLTGSASITNTSVRVGKSLFNFKKFNLNASEETANKKLKINSDFLDCEITGKYVLKELGNSVLNILSSVMPAYFSSKKIKTPQDQQFDIKATFKQAGDFTGLFLPGIEIADGTAIAGNYNSISQELRLDLTSENLKLQGRRFKDIQLKTQLKNKKLNVGVTATKVNITDSLFLKNFDIQSSTQSDSSLLELKWDNKSTPAYKADINAKAVFKSGPLIEFGFLTSEMIFNDSVWKINSNNYVAIDTASIQVRNMEFSSNHQLISINGSSSKYAGDSMLIVLSQFNLGNLNRLLLSSGLKLKGIVDGKTSLAGIYSTPVLISNTNFTGLQINTEVIGNGYVKTIWDSDKDALALNGLFGKEMIPNIVFSGFYYPKKNNSIDMNLSLTKLNMDLFKPFVKDYCKDFAGEFSGNFIAKGTIDHPKIKGVINIDASKVSVNYLGTYYSFKQSILVDTNSFGIENMVLYDQIYDQNKRTSSISEKDKRSGSGTAVVNGKIYHDNFKNFQLDLDIVPRKFMVLNTNENENNLYYGQAYVTGPYINIFGYVNNTISITANVRTDKVTVAKKSGMTKLYIPLSGPTEVSQNNFISFVSHDTSGVKKKNYKVDFSGLSLDFDLDVTPDAEVQMIFDQKVGDVIKARGNGVIKMEINTLGKFNMYGNYTVENGDYLFTLQNVINKRFDIEQGGTVKWSGDPYDAEINLNAVYKLRTALSPIFPPDSLGRYKRRYPVDCKMILTNKLMSPDISFDIDLPSVDEATRRDARNMVNNDLEINRQVFSLMVLGSFVTPQVLAGGSSESGNAGKAASSELLSNQLSNMLSKISKEFDLGVKYRAGDKVSNEELQLALSTQLFNDRLVIDGNVGVSSSVTQNTNTLVGDVNLEYKLTDDGKLRVKAFNRTNDNAAINLSSPYTQGVGVFYREEFNTIGDLYRRYLRQLKKNKTPVPAN